MLLDRSQSSARTSSEACTRTNTRNTYRLEWHKFQHSMPYQESQI